MTNTRDTERQDSILTLTEAADYLKVSEKTVLRMVRSGRIPGAKVSNQWRFLRSVIDDWVMSRMQRSPSNNLAVVANKHPQLAPLRKLISTDGILLNLTPGSKQHILNQLIAPFVARGIVEQPVQYLADLVAREQVVSTAIGDGIAVPHARNPEESGLKECCIGIGICREGTDFDSLDGLPTRLFFLIGSTSTENHLPLMAKTMLMLRNPNVRDGLVEAGSKENILKLLDIKE